MREGVSSVTTQLLIASMAEVSIPHSPSNSEPNHMPLLEAKSYKLNLGEERTVGIWEGPRLQDETSKEALNNQEILQPSKDNNIYNNVKQKSNKSYSQSV